MDFSKFYYSASVFCSCKQDVHSDTNCFEMCCKCLFANFWAITQLERDLSSQLTLGFHKSLKNVLFFLVKWCKLYLMSLTASGDVRLNICFYCDCRETSKIRNILHGLSAFVPLKAISILGCTLKYLMSFFPPNLLKISVQYTFSSSDFAAGIFCFADGVSRMCNQIFNNFLWAAWRRSNNPHPGLHVPNS